MYIIYICKIDTYIHIPLQYCLSRVKCFLLSRSGCCCIPDAAILPSCSDDGVFIPIQYVRSFARKDLAGAALPSAAAICYFPRLFSVPPLNAAIGWWWEEKGCGMYPFQQLPTPRMPAHLCRGRSEGQTWARSYIFW